MAASSGVCKTNAYEVRYIQVAWSLAKQDIAGCYSDINYTVSAEGENSSSRWYYTGPVTVTLGGQTVYSQTSRLKQYAGTLKTGTVRVYHNSSSGAGSLSASIQAAIYYSSVNCTGSGSWALPTISRSSSFTMSASSQECGKSVTFTVNPSSTSFRHVLYYKLGGSWTRIADIAAGTTAYTWTIPTSFADSFPNNTSFSGPVLCETYSGSTYIGGKQSTLTVTVPESYKPTITDITVSEESTNAQKFGLSGKYVKSLSKIKGTIGTSTSNAHGATVKSYSSTLEGTTYAGSPFDSNIIGTAGTVNLVSTITDSRGRTSSKTKSLTVIDYAAPAISLEIHQNGSAVTCTLNGRVYPVNDGSTNKNAKSLQLRWRRSSDTSWEGSDTIPLSDWSFTKSYTATLAHPDETYVFDALLTDKITTSTAEASTGIVCISRLKGGKGVTLFQEATQEGFWINDIRYSLTDAEYTELSTLLGGAISSLSDWFYPVGAVVASTKAAFNPNNIYHGTWQRIAKGKTLVGVNEDDTDFATGKKTGGEKTHTLTVSEMPEHGGHLRSGTWVSDGDFTSKYLSSSVLSSYGAYGRGWDSINGGEAYPARISIGGNSSHNNMQPYYTVYYWERTA